MVVKEKKEAAESKEPILIDKFIFRGGELVSFQVGEKFLSFSELIQLGKNFTYKEENAETKEVIEHKIIVTDLGSGQYLSTKDKGIPIEKTFAKLVS